MNRTVFTLGGFTVEPHGDRISLGSPNGTVETGLVGFMRGINHLLVMNLDLEGQAELDGGLVVRIMGEVVRLTLGQYAETFRLEQVKTFFEKLTAEIQFEY